ncbi:MAG: fibronectin type III-like domain-contianing protein [Clostridia bacterium]|nr:fibronectin type III-like domain-contianing protein [Clostridia bacterium]
MSLCYTSSTSRAGPPSPQGEGLVELNVGEEKTVSFEITEETLKYWNRDLKFVAEKGSFEVFIGKDSNCKVFAKFELV